MRRFRALLIAAGLAATPAGAAAGPHDSTPANQTTFEHFSWSSSKGRLGVMVMGLTPELRRHYGAAADRGVLVARVDPGSAAAAAGVAVGDVIVEVHGRAVDDAHDVIAALQRAGKDDRVTLEVMRAGKPLHLETKLATDPLSWLEIPPPGRSWFRELLRPLLEPQPPRHAART